MTRFSNHLPRVGALVLSAVVALVAYSVHGSQSNAPAEPTAARVAPDAGEPGLAPALKLEEGGQPGPRADAPRRDRRAQKPSTRAQKAAAAPESPAGVRLPSAPAFQPVAAQDPPVQPRAPRPRRDGHGGSPRDLGGLLDDPSAPRRRERGTGDDPDPLSEVFEPLDTPAPPEAPAAPETPETVPAPPATPASPVPVPQVPSGEDVDVEEPVDEPEDEPVDEPDVVPPPTAEPPPASVDPDDETGNADDEDAGDDEQSGEAEDESPVPPGGSEGADAGDQDEP